MGKNVTDVLKEHGGYLGHEEGWNELTLGLAKVLELVDPDYHITTVKEKFGGLRFYADPSDKCTDGDLFYALIDWAEQWSFVTCEMCGVHDVTTETTQGWVKTLCAKDREKRYE